MVPPLPETATYEFAGDVQNVLSGMIPRIYNHSDTITAELAIPSGGAEGVIVAEADHFGGFSLFVDGGKLTHTYSMMGVFVFRQQAEESMPEGEVTVRMQFAADAAKPATGGAVGGALSATVCTPPYLLGRVGILMLGSSAVVVFGLGLVALTLGITLQAGATGAVRAIKMSATLTAARGSVEGGRDHRRDRP